MGFGIEFEQPAIVAEALAQACVHSDWIRKALIPTEKTAKARSEPSNKTLLQLIGEIAADKKLASAAEWDDGNKIRDGILKRAPEEMVKYAAQWTVSEDELEKKTVEMINAAVYVAAAAQHPPKQVKFDFYLMHCVTSSIFFPVFNKQSWIPMEAKIRLLEFKGRVDLVMYPSRRCPHLYEEEIVDYDPKSSSKEDTEWPGIFHRFFEFPDDGHAVKFGRAVRNGQLLSQKYESEEWCKIRGQTWEKIGNMIIDSVEGPGDNWARNVGFDQAWNEIGDRPRKDKL